MIKINSYEITKMYVGGSEIPSAYIGGVQVYGGGQSESYIPLEYIKYHGSGSYTMINFDAYVTENGYSRFKMQIDNTNDHFIRINPIPSGKNVRLSIDSKNVLAFCGAVNKTLVGTSYPYLFTSTIVEAELHNSYVYAKNGDEWLTISIGSKQSASQMPIGSQYCTPGDGREKTIYYVQFFDDNGDMYRDYHPALKINDDGSTTLGFHDLIGGGFIEYVPELNPYEYKFQGVQIQYTTTDGNVIMPMNLRPKINVMNDGVGYMVFDSLTSLPTEAFRGCTTLQTMTLPDSLTSVNIPSLVTEIPNYCFRGCTSLVIDEIPSNITLVGNQAFMGCTSITSLTIGENTRLAIRAFDGCSQLKTLVMLATDDEILETYYNFTPLQNLADNGTLTYFGNELGYTYVLENNGLDVKGWVKSLPTSYIYYSPTTKGEQVSKGSAFLAATTNMCVDAENDIWRLTFDKPFMLGNKTNMSSGLIFPTSEIKSLDLSHWEVDCSQTTRMNGLFYSMRNLTELKGLEVFDFSNVTEFNATFYGCGQIQNLDLSPFKLTDKCNSVDSLFFSCSRLISVNFGEWLVKPNRLNSMFRNCSMLASADLSNWDLTNITDFKYCFDGCARLGSIKFGDKVPTSSSLPTTGLYSGIGSYAYLSSGKIYLKNGVDYPECFTADVPAKYTIEYYD